MFATFGSRCRVRAALIVVVLCTTANPRAQRGPTQAELNQAGSNTADWLLSNHDYRGQRFVDLNLIRRENVASLVRTLHAGRRVSGGPTMAGRPIYA